jgi:F-type H+-transporting ATPase subunit b
MLELLLAAGGAAPHINWFSWANREEFPPLAFAVINFIVLLFVLRRLALPKIRATSDRRHEETRRELEEARRLHREARERLADYEKRLKAIDQEIANLVAAVRAEAEAEAARTIKVALEQADRLKRESEFTMSQELKQLRIDLERETVERAIAAAEKLLRERLTDADQRRLTEQFVGSLETKRPSA